MPRIFAAFVIGQLLVVLAAAGFGLVGSDAVPARHVTLAVFALLLTCFLQVIVFMYLTVTGKIIVQAVHLGDENLAPVYEVKRYKARFVAILGVVVVVSVLVTATGAYQWREGLKSYVHFLCAALFLVVQLVAAYYEFSLICQNDALMNRVLRTYTPRTPGEPAANA